MSAGVADHEGDRIGRHALGGHDEITLVLAILIVHDDDHPTGGAARRESRRRN